jgi:hypothetical protein
MADKEMESQKKTTIRWANTYLVRKKLELTDLSKDLSDGTLLGVLLMKVSRYIILGSLNASDIWGYPRCALGGCKPLWKALLEQGFSPRVLHHCEL